jgi:hypothetical protein
MLRDARYQYFRENFPEICRPHLQVSGELGIYISSSLHVGAAGLSEVLVHICQNA